MIDDGAADEAAGLGDLLTGIDGYAECRALDILGSAADVSRQIRAAR